MKLMPTNCPFCNRSLLNSYYENDKILKKVCNKRVDHNITFSSNYWRTSHDRISYISTDMNDLGLRAVWYPDKKLFNFDKMVVGGDICMAYFVPDLTNYSRLIKKLKTYLTFS